MLFIPADIETFEFKDRVVSLFKPEGDAFNFHFEKLTLSTKNRYGVTFWDEQKRNKYPELIDWIERCFPLDRLINVKLVSPGGIIDEHIDFSMPEDEVALYSHTRSMEPCGYRVILKGSRSGNLYIRDRSGNKKFVEVPVSTDSYLISHTEAVHSLEKTNEERLTIFIQAWIHKDRHLEILEKSKSSYSKYALG